MRPRRHQPAAAGFTLIEVLLAVGIVVTITTLLWGSFGSTFRIKRNTERAGERYHTIYLALDRMARDVSLAYLSLNELPSTVDRHTYFRYAPGMDSRLDFSYMGHQHLYRDSREGDTAIVSYYLGPDPQERNRMHLWRRESRRLVVLPELANTAGSAYIICPDATGLRLSFFDDRQNEWRDDWNTSAADGQPNRLPSRVRIELTVKDENDNAQVFSTDTRIHMNEPVDGRPDQAQ
jgi:general secretion pathway protein J